MRVCVFVFFAED